MKIVISGGAGIGKTTLANNLSKILEYPIIPDYIDEELKLRGLKSPAQLDDSSARKVRLKALERKIDEENKMKDFISDKGVIDYLAYWLLWTSRNATERENTSFLNESINHIKEYGIIVMPKFNIKKIPANKLRDTDFFHQLRVHTLIKGLYTEFGYDWVDYNRNKHKNLNKFITEYI